MTDLIFQTNNFYTLGNIIKKNYETKKNIVTEEELNEFIKLIKLTIEEIMYLLLEKINFNDQKNIYKCQITKMEKLEQGSFSYKNNYFKIIFNKDTIINLYKGNILELLTIFHELNHLLVYYECRNYKVNFDLVRCIKENLLYKLGVEIKTNTKSLKPYNDPFLIEGFREYYQKNYDLYSEEKLVNIRSIDKLFEFTEQFDINLTTNEIKTLKDMLEQNRKKYYNYKRDVSNISIFNSRYIDFDKIFDIMIKKHKEWLRIPQLQIEYYINESGFVCKRTKKELIELLDKEYNQEIISYINTLINNDKTIEPKILKKSIF